MKKTLITASVALALGVSLNVQADNDVLTTPAQIGTTAAGGAKTDKDESKATNSAKQSYNSTFNEAANSNINSGFNDINSHNKVDINEDGIVAYAQDLDQAVASSDLNNLIGGPLGVSSSALGTTAGGNLLNDNSAGGTAAAAGNLNTIVGYENTLTNSVTNGSFNNFGGVSSTSQDLGNMATIGQSVVVQSNGNI